MCTEYPPEVVSLISKLKRLKESPRTGRLVYETCTKLLREWDMERGRVDTTLLLHIDARYEDFIIKNGYKPHGLVMTDKYFKELLKYLRFKEYLFDTDSIERTYKGCDIIIYDKIQDFQFI